MKERERERGGWGERRGLTYAVIKLLLCMHMLRRNNKQIAIIHKEDI